MSYGNGIDFTESALDSMYDAVDDPYFLDNDAELIFKALKSRLNAIPFCDYLKRYIYCKAGLSGRYDEIPIKDYQRIIKDAFIDNHTPASFSQVTSKISALTKNWLTQQTVNRNVVLLLGFGLNMSVEDVNDFLIKALREPGLNFKDPFEIICWYCYKNEYNYLKFNKLWEAYQETPPNSLDMNVLYKEQTVRLRNSANSIHSDASLLSHLSKMKNDKNESLMGVTAHKYFYSLYDSARDIVASMYNSTEDELHSIDVEKYKNKLALNDRLYDFEKQKRIEKKVSDKYIFTRDDITPADIEHVICAAIPLDRHGNLLPLKNSKLNAHFHGKKFSRQRLADILNNEVAVDRFDLITLNFFMYSQMTEDYVNSKSLYSSFVDSTNRILESCSMGELYVANPYECFILMCILSDDPLGTYADVWEMAYDTEP